MRAEVATEVRFPVHRTTCSPVGSSAMSAGITERWGGDGGYLLTIDAVCSNASGQDR
ncbi:hypothetical protein [Dictyobacter arantiisoli]|uniref:Uncharacterized protein n=1 Tax=Dictyobacter arantiisoli TaxID=2014874 RepID=A0A5A5TDN8_9CHLR|nr:hypothetical protein [Dictyobacter arantiisoli]GCF09650.1 hypothetical protein KDI_32140 [Dictyobacter arantiisoli]